MDALGLSDLAEDDLIFIDEPRLRQTPAAHAASPEDASAATPTGEPAGVSIDQGEGGLEFDFEESPRKNTTKR
jgi:hypothetical protein